MAKEKKNDFTFLDDSELEIDYTKLLEERKQKLQELKDESDPIPKPSDS